LYVKVPAVDGVPQIGNRHLYIGVSISPTEAVCHIDDGKLENGWIELTEEEFRQPVPEPAPETTEQKLTRIEEQNLIIMSALADLYEEILTLKEEDV
jgi:hypothetical protein